MKRSILQYYYIIFNLHVWLKTSEEDGALCEVAGLCHKTQALVSVSRVGVLNLLTLWPEWRRSQCKDTSRTCTESREEEPTGVSTSRLDAHTYCSVAVHTWGALAWNRSPSCMCVYVRVCARVCTSPPPGQGRNPQCERQWALTWPLNTDPLQSQGQKLTPYCCQSRLVNEQPFPKSQGAFRVGLCVCACVVYIRIERTSFHSWNILENSGWL